MTRADVAFFIFVLAVMFLLKDDPSLWDLLHARAVEHLSAPAGCTP